MTTKYPKGFKRCCNAIFRMASVPYAKHEVPLRLCFTKEFVFDNGADHPGQHYLNQKFDYIEESNIRLIPGTDVDFEYIRSFDWIDHFSYGDMDVFIEDMFYHEGKYYAIIQYRVY